MRTRNVWAYRGALLATAVVLGSTTMTGCSDDDVVVVPPDNEA